MQGTCFELPFRKKKNERKEEIRSNTVVNLPQKSIEKEGTYTFYLNSDGWK